MPKRVFVGGTWNSAKAEPYADTARQLGTLIAESGYDLVCGPGTGIARFVIDGYRSVAHRGRVVFYLPLQSEMDAAGECVGEGADEVIHTGFDYPMRNVFHIKAVDAVVILTGGDGTLEEALPALIDYHLPVGVLRGTGTAARALELLLDIFPQWTEELIFGEFVQNVWREVARRLEGTREAVVESP